MNMADRIQYLRKVKGISQEELADKVGVSRQAVSKWESEQSSPDLEKVITMSEYFEVTTDYILKGIEPVADENKKSVEITSKILYIASTAFIAIGLLCAFGGWYEEQTMDVVWGSMIIQAVGVAGYFIGKMLSSVKPPFVVNWLNLAVGLFMPVSIFSGFLCRYLSWGKIIAPYPMEVRSIAIFVVIYFGVLITSFFILRRQRK
jgi:transcriptional regulator with XRE-family HTH domain